MFQNKVIILGCLLIMLTACSKGKRENYVATTNITHGAFVEEYQSTEATDANKQIHYYFVTDSSTFYMLVDSVNVGRYAIKFQFDGKLFKANTFRKDSNDSVCVTTTLLGKKILEKSPYWRRMFY